MFTVADTPPIPTASLSGPLFRPELTPVVCRWGTSEGYAWGDPKMRTNTHINFAQEKCSRIPLIRC